MLIEPKGITPPRKTPENRLTLTNALRIAINVLWIGPNE